MRAKLRDSLRQVRRRFALCNEAKSSVRSTITIADGIYGHDTDGFPLAGGGSLGDSGSSSIKWTRQPIMWDYQIAPDPANSHLYTAEASYASETNGYGALSTYGTSALMDVEYEPFDRNPTQQAQLQTPKSLGWREDFKFSDYYDFNVPKEHDPRFTLRSEFPASPFTPRTVYLDNVDNENYLLSCYACRFPDTICWRGESRPVFHRRADLERHYNQVHATDNRLQFHCDYQNCHRKNQPFTRKDHIRDHYIDYHKEDVGKWARETKATDAARWQTKHQEKGGCGRRLFAHWWRCGKCLTRIFVSKDDWRCPTCKRDCEPQRREAREKLPSHPQVERESEDPAPEPMCTFCEDNEWLTMGMCPQCGRFTREFYPRSKSIVGTLNYNDRYGQVPPYSSSDEYRKDKAGDPNPWMGTFRP